ncbi:MAG TPA: hypothetical protein VEF90_09045, partial [Xanthobacteraceae bacterium]|nr:hypothetical protein [Xanthobacteraceae bacterium]
MPTDVDDDGNVTLSWTEVPNVAVPVGTVFGVQFVDVFQAPVPVLFHVAFCACAPAIAIADAIAIRPVTVSAGAEARIVRARPILPLVSPRARHRAHCRHAAKNRPAIVAKRTDST